MTLQDFLNKYIGKHWDFDGAYGPQCMDLYRFYVRDVWQLPQTKPVVGAHQVFAGLDQNVFIKVAANSGEKPRVGDVIIWNEDYVKNGHIAIVTKVTASSFESLEQNNPTNSVARLVNHTYGKSIIGWFRPKSINNQNMKLPLLKFKGSNTVYLVAGWALFPFTSRESFEHAGGDFNDVVEVSDSEMGKYNIRFESHIIKQPRK